MGWPPRSNASVPPAGSSRYQHHSWLKYLRVVGVNPLPALPLPFSLNKPLRLAARSTGSPLGSVPLMHQFTGTGEEIPFLFPSHHFTVFVLFLICCSLVDIKSLFHYLLDTPRPSRLSFPFVFLKRITTGLYNVFVILACTNL